MVHLHPEGNQNIHEIERGTSQSFYSQTKSTEAIINARNKRTESSAQGMLQMMNLMKAMSNNNAASGGPPGKANDYHQPECSLSA